jgi:nucleotide-binding universal stress UspA family protein
MKNILVSIDFDNLTGPLIEHALDLADKKTSRIWLLHVAAPDPDFVGYEVGPQYVRDNRAEVLKEEMAQLTEQADRIEKMGYQADGILIQGATAKTIIKESEKLNIDLIIVGRQQHNFLYNALFGSTPDELIKRSKIPVMVIPEQE